MVFGWLRTLRRRRLLRRPFPPRWQALIDQLPFYAQLDDDQQDRLRQDLRILVAEKDWEGCGGLAMTEEIRVVIAAQAALLVLELDGIEYSNVQSILVYPSAYITHTTRDGAGIVRGGQANLGEAWSGGPIVLAWDAVVGGVRRADDGRNLVFHEFAHKIDMLDGLADGTPPLSGRPELAEWVRVMSAEYAALRAAAAEGRGTVLDTYGATNPAEFFAVATECYFERGPDLERRHPELFAAMARFYHPRETHEA